jgi:hypothetical protein
MILTSKMADNEKKTKFVRVVKPLNTQEKANHALVRTQLANSLASKFRSNSKSKGDKSNRYEVRDT